VLCDILVVDLLKIRDDDIGKAAGLVLERDGDGDEKECLDWLDRD
jgi:hypothetical protein